MIKFEREIEKGKKIMCFYFFRTKQNLETENSETDLGPYLHSIK